MKQAVYFKEEQKVTQLWIWSLMVILVLGQIWALFKNYSVNGGFGGENFIYLLISSIITFSLFFLLVLFKLVTIISEKGVHIQVIPFHQNKVLYPWEEIDQIFVRKYSPIREYGGWGIRGLGKDRAFNVKGNKGIQIIFKDGRRRLIGTSKPKKVEKILEIIPE